MQSQLLAMQAQIDELREAASNNITAVNTKIDALVVDNQLYLPSDFQMITDSNETLVDEGIRLLEQYEDIYERTQNDFATIDEDGN